MLNGYFQVLAHVLAHIDTFLWYTLELRMVRGVIEVLIYNNLVWHVKCMTLPNFNR